MAGTGWDRIFRGERGGNQSLESVNRQEYSRDYAYNLALDMHPTGLLRCILDRHAVES